MDLASQKRSHGEDETEDGREEQLALLQTEEGGRGSIYQDAPVVEHRPRVMEATCISPADTVVAGSHELESAAEAA